MNLLSGPIGSNDTTMNQGNVPADEYGVTEVNVNKEDKPLVSVTNLNRDNSTAYSMATFNQPPRVTSGTQANKPDMFINDELKSNVQSSSKLVPEEYKRLMLVRDPSKTATSSFRVKKNTVHVKQAIAL